MSDELRKRIKEFFENITPEELTLKLIENGMDIIKPIPNSIVEEFLFSGIYQASYGYEYDLECSTNYTKSKQYSEAA